ncbi:MAG: hypothetical protein AB7P16_28685 [Bradyrhizobium sp.]|uniref:hypothetical protein n=1 Tax=Bradyrhizobium sp. TaxID=376 RepID=UPI003D0A034C
MRVIGYEFAEGVRFQSGAIGTPNEVGAHLDLLRKQLKGELTAQEVVDDARNPNSPLHSYFEWNDGIAAAQHRLKQARGLIRAVVAIYRDEAVEKKPVVRVKAFTHIPEGETSHYRDTAHAMSQKSTRDAVFRSAWRELLQWRQRYHDLTQFAALIEVIDDLGTKLPSSIRNGLS